MKRENKDDFMRQYRLAHQSLCIKHIDFDERTLFGFVELTIHPLVHDLQQIKLNCKQCLIYKIVVNEHWEAEFQYNDPAQEICYGDVGQCNLDFFHQCHLATIESTDPDRSQGELTVDLPLQTIPIIKELRPFRLVVEFSLVKPSGGLHYVLPKLGGRLAERNVHMFTCGKESNSRLWFPCIDAFSEPCTWTLDVTVDASMLVVASGELIDCFHFDFVHGHATKKNFHFYLSAPTAAPNIGMAVGPFVVHVDPHMYEVTHLCLPGLQSILKHTTSYMHQSFEFYEELLSKSNPYACYKQVFVDESYVDGCAYATLGILSTNLLHSSHIIDQTIITRKVMARLIAEQFFGCFLAMQAWSDAWLTKGISSYLSALFQKKTFGNNEFRYMISRLEKEVSEYEQQTGGILLDPSRRESNLPFSVKHAHTVSPGYAEMMEKKSLLVIRMLELRIGTELLLQVLNKILAVAISASQQRLSSGSWSNMLISTASFLKIISTVTGKDMHPFIEQWVHQSGCARFSGGFVFNRKRNVVEIDIRQDLTARGGIRYVGPLTVTIQELDGSFNHMFKVEENQTKFEILCHSKSRRNKKKKIPLMNGEEVDMDLSAMDSDSPVLWISIDPDMQLLRQVVWEQPDYMWQYQLKYERDVVAQRDAAFALEHFPSPSTRLALTDTIENESCFYQVRIQACSCLAMVANAMVTKWQGPPAMMAIFRKMFGSNSCPAIIRQNNFSNLQHYFILKMMVQTMATLRDVNGVCLPDIVKFLLDLFKYNDNSKNKYSDNYYRAALVDALSLTVTSAVSSASLLSGQASYSAGSMTNDMMAVVEEIVRILNMEKLLPSYRFTVTVSCLRALRQLQRYAHLPSDATLFRQYAQYGLFRDVRVASLDCLVDLIRTESNAEELDFVLSMVENDKDDYIRHQILRVLTVNPPFKKLDFTRNPLNTERLVERLWKLMNCTLSFDCRLRCGVADLYYAMYGRARPACLPLPQLTPTSISKTSYQYSPVKTSVQTQFVEQVVLEEGEVLMDMEVDEVVVESDFTLGVKSASPIKNLVITTALSRPPPVINDRDSPSHSSSGDGERPCAKRWKPDDTGIIASLHPSSTVSAVVSSTALPMSALKSRGLGRTLSLDSANCLSEDSDDELSSTALHSAGVPEHPIVIAGVPMLSDPLPAADSGGFVDTLPSAARTDKSKKKKKGKHRHKHKRRHVRFDGEGKVSDRASLSDDRACGQADSAALRSISHTNFSSIFGWGHPKLLDTVDSEPVINTFGTSIGIIDPLPPQAVQRFSDCESDDS